MSASETIGKRIQVVNTVLGQAAMHFLLGRNAAGVRALKAANVDLTTLRVAVDQMLGPPALPRQRSKRSKRR